jgi:hypothetical protein
MTTKLGKIESVRFGLGGYQDACIGIHFTLSADGWGVSDTRSAWDKNLIKHSEYCKWSEAGRSQQYVELVNYVSDLLADAKVQSVDQLKGMPVEVQFENNTLKSWRILKEVL